MTWIIFVFMYEEIRLHVLHVRSSREHYFLLRKSICPKLIDDFMYNIHQG